jgi:hypothetical protein
MKNDFRCPHGAPIPENFRTFPEYPMFKIVMERMDRWAEDQCTEGTFMRGFHQGEETTTHCFSFTRFFAFLRLISWHTPLF